jgi:methionine synthase II (cobalamin-independent)
MGGVRSSLGLALTGVLLLAGCGHTGTSTVKSSSGAASTAATGTSSTGTGPGSKASREQVATACARAIEKAPTIAPSVKPHLVQICEKAASPDVATRRKAAREACVELVIAAHIAAGPSRERALAICNRP